MLEDMTAVSFRQTRQGWWLDVRKPSRQERLCNDCLRYGGKCCLQSVDIKKVFRQHQCAVAIFSAMAEILVDS